MNKLLLILTIPLMAMMAVSCNFVQEPGRPCEVGGSDDMVRFEFQVVSSNITDAYTANATRHTRTDNAGHDEVDSEWRDFEDAIDAKNFAFYVFLGTDANAPLLAKVPNIAASTDPDMMITGSQGSYTVSFVIQKTKLEELLGRELDPSSDAAVQMRVVGLANIQNSNAEWFDDLKIYTNVACSTFQELIDNTSQWTFDMSRIYSPNDGDHIADGMYKGNIPMFGTMIMTTTESELYHSRYDNRIWFGTMSMLRSVAKMRVEDKIQSKDPATGLPRVEQVLFQGSTDNIYPLPYNAINYQNGQQVHTPYICTQTGTTLPGNTPNSFWFGTLPGGPSTLQVGYVPEQAIKEAETTPYFSITVTFSLDAAGRPAKQETYIVPMTGYDGYQNPQPFEFGDNILRNHIYTLQVNDARTGFPADITISVADWNEETFTFDYADNFSMMANGTIAITGGAASYNLTEGQAVMQPWHDELPVPLTCTFGISTPRGASWTASFITVSGEQGAFAFLSTDAYGNYLKDNDGNYVLSETASGSVDGKISTLHIVSTDPDPSQQNVAYLQVVMEHNGKFMVVPIRTASADTEYFRIIQNTLK